VVENERVHKGRGVRGDVWATTMDDMNAPFFVTIDKPWRHSVDVCAGANKQENDEKEPREVGS